MLREKVPARAFGSGYNATKWGLNGWSEALRQELLPDVRVMVIEPGAVATELTDHITDSSVKDATEKFYGEVAITAAGHRRDHRLRGLTPAAGQPQRDPGEAHGAGALTRSPTR